MASVETVLIVGGGIAGLTFCFTSVIRGWRCGSALRVRPSRPGEFHPEPLTDPDVTLSRHPARAIARRLPPSAEPSGSSRYDPVGPSSTAMTHPLRSTGITPLQHYKETGSPPQLDSDDAAMTYERFIRCGSAKPVANYYGAVRPSPAHRYFRPRGWSRLCLFP